MISRGQRSPATGLWRPGPGQRCAQPPLRTACAPARTSRSVRAALGDVEPAPLPDGPLPAAKLVDYLGPRRWRGARLPAGHERSVRSTGGFTSWCCRARAGTVPPLAEIEDEVRRIGIGTAASVPPRSARDAARALTLEVTAAP